LSQIDSINGNGQLNINERGSVKWLINPYKTAAPILNILYAVSGALLYRVDGEEVTIPLYPLTVGPDPELHLIYFLEKYVQSDDPMTTNIEPTIPFTLDLLLSNRGHGTAKRVSSTSKFNN
jgi:hypothetical protein